MLIANIVSNDKNRSFLQILVDKVRKVLIKFTRFHSSNGAVLENLPLIVGPDMLRIGKPNTFDFVGSGKARKPVLK